MPEFKEGQIVKTVRDNDFAIKLVDGASGSTATKKLSVAQHADNYSAGVNDFGVPILVKCSDGKLRIPNADSAGNITAIIGNPSGAAIQTAADIAASVANGTPVNVDTVITTGKTVSGLNAQVSSTGLFDWRLGTFDGTAFVFFVGGITSPASPFIKVSSSQMPVGDGTLAIRLIITNLDANPTDALYDIEWIEE